MKRMMLTTTALVALAAMAFTTAPALAIGPELGTTSAITSTSAVAKTGIFDPTLKTSTVLQTKSFYDTQQFGTSKSLANNTYIPAAKHFMVATDTKQGPADKTGGKKMKVTDAGWAAVLGTTAGLKAVQQAQTAVSMRDRLKTVAFIDQADQPAPVTFHTAASRGYFAA